MSLFGFGKKKEEERRASACCCSEENAGKTSACCSEGNAGETSTCCGSQPGEHPCCGDTAGGISIKVLGAGCKSCHAQYENAKAAVRAMGLNAGVEYITDMEEVMRYGAMSMPAIAINGQVVSMGKVLKAADVEKLLRQLGC